MASTRKPPEILQTSLLTYDLTVSPKEKTLRLLQDHRQALYKLQTALEEASIVAVDVRGHKDMTRQWQQEVDGIQRKVEGWWLETSKVFQTSLPRRLAQYVISSLTCQTLVTVPTIEWNSLDSGTNCMAEYKALL
ncbi:MAG: hypothetical protein L6R40_003891 [Gallowayella cf. fulva]|nr:MAG: hypothetical protein L6R40_003891 [Xanthomendoza cf. fulva]